MLIYGTPSERNVVLFRMKQYGVDGVRATMLWSLVAQDAMKGRRGPSASGPTTPAPIHAELGPLRRHRPRGPRPTAWWCSSTSPARDPSGRTPRPRTSSQRRHGSPRRGPTTRSSARSAGATRASTGTRTSAEILPRVSFWSIWNEPNQGASLTPQSEYNPLVKKIIPTAPVIYRRLLYAGIAGLRNSGHKSDVILAGETAPLGKDEVGHRKQLRPKVFLRELFCLKPNLTPYTGRDAKARECDLFKKKGPFSSRASRTTRTRRRTRPSCATRTRTP